MRKQYKMAQSIKDDVCLLMHTDLMPALAPI